MVRPWSSATAWAQTSPWPWVTEQATPIGMVWAIAWPSDPNVTQVTSRPWASEWSSGETWATDTNTDTSCNRHRTRHLAAVQTQISRGPRWQQRASLSACSSSSSCFQFCPSPQSGNHSASPSLPLLHHIPVHHSGAHLLTWLGHQTDPRLDAAHLASSGQGRPLKKELLPIGVPVRELAQIWICFFKKVEI